jgi:beta-N-acetylhexosaminidase
MYILLLLSFFQACFAFDMTLDEKVGQLLMVQFHGEATNEDARVLIQDVGVGGIIYYDWCNKLHTLSEIRALSDGLQGLAECPLLIAADQEGGKVLRFREAFSPFPGNGKMDRPDMAREMAYDLGMEMKVAGINMNLAPVVDVNCNPENPVIGARAFSDNTDKVVAFGREALKGYKKAGVLATLKHYPGHGDTGVDSHQELAVVNKSREALEQMELVPFQELAKEADAIMTAHILVPAFDPDNCATLSQKTLSFLRDTIGFKGVIVSDSLVMEGVLKKCASVDEAAIQALNAGCDILLLGGKLLAGEKAGFELTVSDVKRIHGTIVEAVKQGRIPESRVDEAVSRILRMKHCL